MVHHAHHEPSHTSVSDKMYTRVVLWTALAALTVAADTTDTALISDCPHQSLTPFYRSLGCLPLNEHAAQCPTSYDCSQFEARDPTVCHAGTKSFNVSESVDDSPTHCQVECFCENHIKEDGRPHIVCAHVDCPWGPFEPGCSYKYSSEQCCPTIECSEKSSVETITCDFENKTMKEGETFHPENNPCTTCQCMKGFKGVVEEPFCKQEDCKTQIYYSSGQKLNDGCAPIFYGTNRCCPIDWMCPDESDTIVKSISKSNSKTTASCKFGHSTLEPGDSLNITSPNVLNQQCFCDLPPFITCIQPEHKYTNN